MRQTCHLTVILLGLSMCIAPPGGSAQTAKHPHTAAGVKAPLRVEDVIKMSQAGLSDDIIIQKIKARKEAFDLSTDELLQLKNANVSNHVIEVMMDPSKADGSKPTKEATAAPVEAPPPPVESPKPAAAPETAWPSDIGIYYKKKGQWAEILPEIVNWKTGGVLKSVATVGIVKGDLNGHLVGPHSRNDVNTPLEFTIVVPEGTAITEYQLLRLRTNGNNREFRTVTGGVMHVQSGATRDVVAFDGKKVSSRVYSVLLPLDIGVGEYGFLPPGASSSTNAAGSAGKLYSFRVVE